jgi:glycerophosphoryl diester phosphodiesterase
MTSPPELSSFRLFAHRGASAHAPENTLGAVRRALAMGARWLEVDVHAAAGRLVVIHDDTLDRTTDGRGPVADADAAYLRGLDAGDGAPPPWLEEVLELLGPRHGINVELKGSGTAEPAAAILGREVDGGARSPEELLVSSFDPGRLRRFRALRPDIPLGCLGGRVERGLLEAARRLGARSVHVERRSVDAAAVEAVHAAGLLLFVFTVNSAAELRRLRGLGVDGAFTDRPELGSALDPEGPG